MEIKTFDTILTSMCDTFDSLISPKRIARSNANVIYLMFKAIAKGYEVINNVCVVLSNKFDPKSCLNEDLDSSASLVGTERYKGSASGLRIIATNNSEQTVDILPGVYQYSLDDDTTFEFEVVSSIAILQGSYTSFIAMSTKIGRYVVTEQTSIEVTSEQEISPDITFSCRSNDALLGTLEETDLAFRERLCSKTDRQDAFVELEDEIKNLPYIFDCKIKFNDTLSSIVYDNITIPSFTALICYAGAIKSELAEKVCAKIICPTVQTESSIGIQYESETFINGSHTVYFTPFQKTQYGIEVIYKINNTYANNYDIQKTIRTALFNRFVAETHKDYVKEDEIYDVIKGLALAGIELLGVSLIYEGNKVNYIEIPSTRVPELVEVEFNQEY